MVEYALAGMDNQLFVSTYMLQLPDKKTLENFLLKQLGKWEYLSFIQKSDDTIVISLINLNQVSG